MPNESEQILGSFRCNKIRFDKNFTLSLFEEFCNGLHNWVKEHINEVIFEYETPRNRSEEESKFDMIGLKIRKIVESLPTLSTINVINTFFEKDTLYTVLNYCDHMAINYEVRTFSGSDITLTKHNWKIYWKSTNYSEIKVAEVKSITVKAHFLDLK